MNKKEVSMFLTGITGRLLCAEWSDFHKWAEERVCRPIFTYEFAPSLGDDSIQKEIADSITDTEWREIADFFIESGGSDKVEEK